MTRPLAPGDAMLHPLALASLALLIFNDHVLKIRAPGVVSGKLSDVAILVVGPLLLQGVVEVAAARGGRAWRPSSRVLLATCVLTGAAFALEKSLASATRLYSLTWGALRWPLDTAIARIAGHPSPAFAPVAAVTDPTDLATLPALWLAWRVHRARGAGRSAGRSFALW